MILILTDAFDAHADVVTSHLTAKRAPFFRLNLDKEALVGTTVSLEGNASSISSNHQKVNISKFRCVWARRLSVSTNVEDETDASPGYRLWKGEWNRCLFGVYSLLRGAKWINPIGPSSLIDNKFHQMREARGCGFDIPPMITSNCKNRLTHFAQEHGDVALKFLSQEIFKSESGEILGTYVNKIGKTDLSSFADNAENPITLQKYVDKQYEARLTYVDGKCFSCRIDSQSSTRSNVDWRRYDIAGTPHYQITTPSHVEGSIRKFMEKAELIYGAFDFIVDRDDRWWYLEVNSAGQWLWIEDLVQLPISQAVADCLVKRAKEI